MWGPTEFHLNNSQHITYWSGYHWCLSLLHNFRFIHVGIGHFVFNMLMQVIQISYYFLSGFLKLFKYQRNSQKDIWFHIYVYYIIIISSKTNKISLLTCYFWDIEESSTLLVDVQLNSFRRNSSNILDIYWYPPPW